MEPSFILSFIQLLSVLTSENYQPIVFICENATVDTMQPILLTLTAKYTSPINVINLDMKWSQPPGVYNNFRLLIVSIFHEVLINVERIFKFYEHHSIQYGSVNLILIEKNDNATITNIKQANSKLFPNRINGNFVQWTNNLIVAYTWLPNVISTDLCFVSMHIDLLNMTPYRIVTFFNKYQHKMDVPLNAIVSLDPPYSFNAITTQTNQNGNGEHIAGSEIKLVQLISEYRNSSLIYYVIYPHLFKKLSQPTVRNFLNKVKKHRFKIYNSESTNNLQTIVKLTSENPDIINRWVSLI